MGGDKLETEMTGITELMIASGVVGFLAGVVAMAVYVAYVIWPVDPPSESDK